MLTYRRSDAGTWYFSRPSRSISLTAGMPPAICDSSNKPPARTIPVRVSVICIRQTAGSLPGTRSTNRNISTESSLPSATAVAGSENPAADSFCSARIFQTCSRSRSVTSLTPPSATSSCAMAVSAAARSLSPVRIAIRTGAATAVDFGDDFAGGIGRPAAVLDFSDDFAVGARQPATTSMPHRITT